MCVYVCQNKKCNVKKKYISFREADVKAEHFERKVQQLETISSNSEKKNEELKEKIIELQSLLDDFNAQLEDI